jgi:hypothetical protein
VEKQKVAGNEARNMVMNVTVIKNNLVAVKGPEVAVVFARSGSEGLQGSGNTALAGQDGWLGRPLMRWQLVPLMRVMYSIYWHCEQLS